MSRNRLFSGLPLVGGPVLVTADFSAAGLVAKWDVSGPFSKRGTYNSAPPEFAYLATDPLPFRLYIKQGSTGNDTDWSPGQPISPNVIGDLSELMNLRDLLLGNSVPVMDTDYQMFANDRIVGMRTLSTTRTVYLPTAATFQSTMGVLVGDMSGQCSDARLINIMPRPGSGDTIAGAELNTIQLFQPYQNMRFEKGANNLWVPSS